MKTNILEQKLKKKNEILKKARIKRKNQREELNKLNLKLQKCISLEEYKYIKKDNEYNLQLKEDRIKDLEDCNERLMQQNKYIKDSLDNLMDIRNNQNNEIEQLKAENIEMGKLVNLNKSALDLAVMTKDLVMKTVEEQHLKSEKLKAENKSLKESSKISCSMLHSQKDTIVSLRDDVINKVDNMRDIKNKEIEKLKAVIEYLESKVK